MTDICPIEYPHADQHPIGGYPFPCADCGEVTKDPWHWHEGNLNALVGWAREFKSFIPGQESPFNYYCYGCAAQRELNWLREKGGGVFLTARWETSSIYPLIPERYGAIVETTYYSRIQNMTFPTYYVRWRLENQTTFLRLRAFRAKITGEGKKQRYHMWFFVPKDPYVWYGWQQGDGPAHVRRTKELVKRADAPTEDWHAIEAQPMWVAMSTLRLPERARP